MEVTRRFDEIGFKDEVEEFNKLQQEGSVRDYQEKFEELRSLMLIKDPRLSESYFVQVLLAGLKMKLNRCLGYLNHLHLWKLFRLQLFRSNP